MKKIAAIIVAATIFMVIPSCRKVIGDGPVVTEARNVSNFTGISSEMSGRVNFTIAPDYKVEITGQQNILDVLKTNVVNGVLHIDFKNGVRVRNYQDLVINVTAPYADYFRLSGTGEMNVHGTITANNLKLSMSGAADITVERAVIADKIGVDISGTGNINVISGSAKFEEVDISGSGKVGLGDITARSALTHTSGSGDVKLNLSENLEVHISGSGSVYYHGNPSISTHISGSGKVIPF